MIFKLKADGKCRSLTLADVYRYALQSTPFLNDLNTIMPLLSLFVHLLSFSHLFSCFCIIPLSTFVIQNVVSQVIVMSLNRYKLNINWYQKNQHPFRSFTVYYTILYYVMLCVLKYIILLYAERLYAEIWHFAIYDTKVEFTILRLWSTLYYELLDLPKVSD